MKRMVRMSLLGLFAVSLLASCNNNKGKDGKDDGFTAKEPELKEDYTETALGVNMDMVYVKGGIFNMGATSEQEEYAQWGDEKPVRTVMLDGFHIGKFEVTQAQWKAVMGTTLEEKAGSYSIKGEGDNYPMYYVSWNDAQEFCKKLSEATGKKYVLPTEAMWEYAARGGVHKTKTLYAGSDDIDEVAWYYSNSEIQTYRSTHEVGTKKANALGIYDMSGNVQEWVSDYYKKGYDEKAILINPQGPKTGNTRVLRGGGYDYSAKWNRVSARRESSSSSDGNDNYYDNSIGFRVAVLL